jgi:hypothetical protein
MARNGGVARLGSVPFVEAASCRSCLKCGKMPHLLMFMNNRAYLYLCIENGVANFQENLRKNTRKLLAGKGMHFIGKI